LFHSATVFGIALGVIEVAKLVIAPSTEVSGTDIMEEVLVCLVYPVLL